MAHYFDEELAGLKEKLVTMASHAEAAVNRSIKALVERSDEIASHAKEHDRVIDQFEIEIDEMAIHLLAKAPLASDLRLISIAMKISRDLEASGCSPSTRRAVHAHDFIRDSACGICTICRNAVRAPALFPRLVRELASANSHQAFVQSGTGCSADRSSRSASAALPCFSCSNAWSN